MQNKLSLVNGFIPYIVSIPTYSGSESRWLCYGPQSLSAASTTGFIRLDSVHFPLVDKYDSSNPSSHLVAVHIDRFKTITDRSHLTHILRYLTEVEQDELGNPIVWDSYGKWIGPLCPIFNHLWANLSDAQIMQ